MNFYESDDLNNSYWLKSMKEKIEKEDEEYRLKGEYRKEKWRVQKKIERKLKTIFGLLVFKITKYQRINEDGKIETKQFENDFLLKNRNYQIEVDLQKLLVNWVIKGISATELASKFDVSRTYIINLVKTKAEQVKEKNFIEESKDKNILYINLDDTFLSLKKNNRKMKFKHRMLVISTGLNEKREMKNLSLIIEDRAQRQKCHSVKELIEITKNVIKEKYGNKNFKILVMGDGASWIKRIAKGLDATYITDIYHILANGNKVLGYYWNKYKSNKEELKKAERKLNIKFMKEYKKLVLEFKFQEVIELLENILSNAGALLSEQKTTQIKKLINYLIKNDLKTENYLPKNGYQGTHTEISVSHYLKKFIIKRFSTFSQKTARAILKLNEKPNNTYIFI
ncbi:Mbov_0401 family ICE element transposase-like protein [Mesomycoplasma lagogenitalium]|uniref:Transposase n=1 Tax=Mesomycoplasma lagogenitalium TaxID=171286 RepID=A0ABY8LUX2_9BACT|nr:UPF0236 family protein [Mesomycoplasma lagogenitalium]WGI36525.1 hypothetical protein QEG99_03605 [Mesomycoplasma lagogenitalium]